MLLHLSGAAVFVVVSKLEFSEHEPGDVSLRVCRFEVFDHDELLVDASDFLVRKELEFPAMMSWCTI